MNYWYTLIRLARPGFRASDFGPPSHQWRGTIQTLAMEGGTIHFPAREVVTATVEGAITVEVRDTTPREGREG